MEDYLELFISELDDYMEKLNKQLLVLEAKNNDTGAIAEVFRVFHTIKGMAQAMGFNALGDMSHQIEDFLGDSKQQGEITSDLVDILFSVVDLLNDFSQALKDKKKLPSVEKILTALDRMKQGEKGSVVEETRAARSISEIRVRMNKLDTLFNLANELMIVRSRMAKLSVAVNNPKLTVLSETAGRLISSLQDEVMRLRMLPLSTVFDFFPRWFRDEAKRQEKDVQLEILGGEIEVDRSIIDMLKEPLLHLLRNALDHGVDVEKQGAKKKQKIVLQASRERERIIISVVDYGKGIDIDEIRKKAIQKGFVGEQETKHLRKEDYYRFLLQPGFSTRDEVSAISGRGIGLDIVERATTKLGGKFTIISEKNKGSCFMLELPLSLAIVRAMIFKLNGQRFALPLHFVKETLYIEEKHLKSIYHRELLSLRDEILPTVRLSSVLDCKSGEGQKSVIIVEHQGKRRAFISDDIIDEEEIVVKKLDRLLETPYYSGCSIYADGRPILILDPRGFE